MYLKVCHECANRSEHYPSMKYVCDIDGHEIKDVFLQGCGDWIKYRPGRLSDDAAYKKHTATLCSGMETDNLPIMWTGVQGSPSSGRN